MALTIRIDQKKRAGSPVLRVWRGVREINGLNCPVVCILYRDGRTVEWEWAGNVGSPNTPDERHAWVERPQDALRMKPDALINSYMVHCQERSLGIVDEVPETVWGEGRDEWSPSGLILPYRANTGLVAAIRRRSPSGNNGGWRGGRRKFRGRREKAVEPTVPAS